ncbi:MAG: hypothetical protein ACXAEX_03835 [Promethearchaeota archaeon]|jgi:hypothetical protein
MTASYTIRLRDWFWTKGVYRVEVRAVFTSESYYLTAYDAIEFYIDPPRFFRLLTNKN